MKVYGLCDQYEIDEILNNKNFNNIGNFYKTNKDVSTHTYNPNKKYLHFFMNKYSLLFLSMKSGKFICTYDIPDNILKTKAGYEKYLDIVTAKENVPVFEYAIECELINFKHLIKVDKIIKDITCVDFFFNESLTNLTKNVFDKENENTQSF